MASLKNVEVTLASAVATSGTFTVTYPTGTDAAWFISAPQHTLQALGATFTSPADFGITTWGADTATITWRASSTLPAGTVVRVQLNIPGPETYRKNPPLLADNVRPMFPLRVFLGTPITADADGIATVQTAAGAGDFTLDGAQVASGVATLDVARNVTLTGATTDHSAVTFTVTGTDVDGNAVVETMAGPNNNTTAGVKAFKTVTQVAVDGAIATNGVSVGFGDVLGLPFRIGATTDVIGQLLDGANASAGTIVAGLSPVTVSTATTADVRGTYDPNAACNGTRAFELFVLASDPDDDGNPQYTG